MRLRVGYAGVAVAAAALLLVACSNKTAVTLAQPDQTGTTVTVPVPVVPDIAQLTIDVEVPRPTVAEARTRAAAANQAVRDALAKNGVAEKDIATQFFNINPQYVFRPDGTGQRITGYMMTNQLSVKVRDLDRLSKALDDAIAPGGDAVRVNGIEFTIDRPEQFANEARTKAMADARQRAEQLASLAGVKLGKARAISKSVAGTPLPQLRAFQSAAADVPTPLSPGESEITLSVFVIYDVE